MKFLKESRSFFVLIILICIGLIIALYDQVSFIFAPVQAFFASLFTPILIAVFVFYIFLPIYRLIKRKITSDTIAIPIVFIIIIAVVYFIISTLLPSLFEQITQFITMVPSIFGEIVSWVEDLLIEYNISSGDLYQYLYDLDISITNIATNILEGFTMGITSVLSLTIRSAIVIFTVPLLLFYFFKDGHKLPKHILCFTPKKYKNLISDLIEAFHFNAAQYIGGRVLVCIYVAIASYIVFTILDIPNALLLGIITGIFDIIPYFGPFIGAAPAFFVAITISPTTAILLILLITVIQLLESYLVTPLVMGKSLEMHPITVVLLVLFANELAGLLGMILILPIYAILKACVAVIYDYYKKYREDKRAKEQTA